MPTSRAIDLSPCLQLLVLIASLLVIPVVNTQETVAVRTTITATPTAPHPPSYTSLDDFKTTVLRVTNAYRQSHDARPLVWNESLGDYAGNWADRCIWQHSHGPYGENLAFGFPNASSAISAWGNEGSKYNYHTPTGFTEATGHFTQLVWQSTRQVGCAAVDCGYTHQKRRRGSLPLFLENMISVLVPREADGTSRAQGWFVVCEYLPAGNVIGKFQANVRPGNSSDSASLAASGKQPGLGMMLLALGVVGMGMGLCT